MDKTYIKHRAAIGEIICPMVTAWADIFYFET